MVDYPHIADSVKSSWSYPDDAQQRRRSDNLRWSIASRPYGWRPPTDVYETEEAFVVRVEIAGMREADFTISLEERFLMIRGTRTDIIERRAYHQMEIPFGEFSCEVELPSPVNSASVQASYRDGFLRVILPKAGPVNE